MQKEALVNSTTDTLKKTRLRDRIDRAWFSRLVQHPARKWSGSILTIPEPAWGLLSENFCITAQTASPQFLSTFLNEIVLQSLDVGTFHLNHLQLLSHLVFPLSLMSTSTNIISSSHTHTLSLSPLYRPFSRWTWVSRYQNVSILDFTGAKDDGDGDNWSRKTCKAPNCHHQQTKFNQHPGFFLISQTAFNISACQQTIFTITVLTEASLWQISCCVTF